MSGASKDQLQDIGPGNTPRGRKPRRRRHLLVAAGAVAALAVSWGGIAAVGTLTQSDALSAQAPHTAAPEASVPSSAPEAVDAPAGAPSSGPAGDADPNATPGPESTPGSSGVPVQGTGRHEGHGSGTGSGGGSAGSAAVRPGAGVPGSPLVGEEPEPPASGQAAARPGSQQETSLDAAAAQPVAVGAAAPDAAGGGGRTEGLTPRAPIDPAEVTGGGQASLGGCLPEYGTNGQCLPVVPPSMAEHAQQMVESGISLDTMPHPWSCTEVRQLFPDGLAVRQAGVDPQNLDTTGDGTACGTGD